MNDNIREIATGLFADPKDVKHIYHIPGSGRIAIYLDKGDNEKWYSPEKVYTPEEFRAFGIRIQNGDFLRGETPEPEPEPEKLFNPDNVKVLPKKEK